MVRWQSCLNARVVLTLSQIYHTKQINKYNLFKNYLKPRYFVALLATWQSRRDLEFVNIKYVFTVYTVYIYMYTGHECVSVSNVPVFVKTGSIYCIL